jgi:hypothetical protein
MNRIIITDKTDALFDQPKSPEPEIKYLSYSQDVDSLQFIYSAACFRAKPHHAIRGPVVAHEPRNKPKLSEVTVDKEEQERTERIDP